MPLAASRRRLVGMVLAPLGFPCRVALFASLLILLGGGIFRLGSQGISEDEIRWGSRPYAPEPPNAIRVQSTLVQVPVLVTDSHGKPVAGLKQGDFHVFDKGREEALSFFQVEHAPTGQPEVVTVSGTITPGTPPVAPPTPPKPRYVAFFFDDDNLPMSDMVFAREAAKKYVQESLNPGDKIGIFTSSTTVSLNFTTNKQKLIETLDQLRTATKLQLSMACPKLDTHIAYLIYNHLDEDAHQYGLALTLACGGSMPRPMAENVLQVAAAYTSSQAENFSRQTTDVLTDVLNYLGRADGSRMLLIASSGFFAESNTMHRELDKVVDAAVRNGIIVNALDAKGLTVGTIGGNPADFPEGIGNGRLEMIADLLTDETKEVFNDPLAAIAQGTGGKFFHNNNDLGRGLRELTAVPEVSYVVGYAPERIVRDGSYHSLKVKLTNQSGLKITARPGISRPPDPSLLRKHGARNSPKKSSLPITTLIFPWMSPRISVRASPANPRSRSHFIWTQISCPLRKPATARENASSSSPQSSIPRIVSSPALKA